MDQEIQDAFTKQAANWLGLVYLLVDKGIITEEEVSHAIMKATSDVDQELARQKEEQQNNLSDDQKRVADALEIFEKYKDWS